MLSLIVNLDFEVEKCILGFEVSNAIYVEVLGYGISCEDAVLLIIHQLCF